MQARPKGGVMMDRNMSVNIPIMDRNQRAVMSMHIRRLGDGDKAQYLQHFKESRDITVGEYQEYMEDSDRKVDILRNLGAFSGMDAGIPAGPGAGVSAGVIGGTPSMLPSLLSAAVSPLAAPIAAAASEVNDHMKKLEGELHKQMGVPASVLGDLIKKKRSGQH